MHLSTPTLDNLYAVLPWRAACPEALRTTRVLTRADQRKFYRAVIRNPQSPHRYYAVMRGRVFLGLVSLEHIDRVNGHAEIGLIIDPAHAGQGYGREAVRLVLQKARALKLQTIFGEVYECNVAGLAFWSRIVIHHGGTATTWPRRKLWKGRLYDALLFTIPLDRRGQ